MEKKLHIEFLQLRKKWTSVKIWWYTLRGDHMPSDLYLETKFKFPGYWFNHFTKRKTMQLREKADKSRKNSANFRLPIQLFQAKLLQERKRGVWKLRNLANMDQTPLPFIMMIKKWMAMKMDDNKTFDSTGVEEVWCATGNSGLDSALPN